MWSLLIQVRDSYHSVQSADQEGAPAGAAHRCTPCSLRDRALDTIQSRWQYGLTVLGCYGFLVEMKPSEPYLTPYLAEEKHFTNEEINNGIYPFWTYGQLVVVCLVPLMANVITPKRMFYVETLGFLLTRAFLIWGSSLSAMRLMQLTYAVGTAVKAVYYSYAYLLFDRPHCGIATGVVWAAQACGACLSGVLGQLLVAADVSYLALNYVSMGSVCVALLLACLVPDERYGSRDEAAVDAVKEGPGAASDAPAPASPASRRGASTAARARPIVEEYGQALSLFQDQRGPLAATWILTKCAEQLVQNYASNLWYGASDDPRFYGGVVALYQGLGVVGALLPACARLLAPDDGWRSTLLRTVQRGAHVGLLSSLVLMTATDALGAMYGAYVAFGFCYYAVIADVSCGLAAAAPPSAQVFVFAANLFCAAVLETCTTLVLSNGDVRPRTWFVVACGVQGLAVLVYFCQSAPRRPGTEAPMEIERVCHAAPDLNTRGGVV